MKILGVGVDKLTVIGNLYIDAEGHLQNIVNQPHCKVIGTPLISAVRAQLYDGLVYIEYDKVMGEAYKRGNMRLEYNPNKISEEILRELVSTFKPMMHDVHFSRMDIAFDCDFNLSEYQHQFGQALKGAVFYGQDKGIETLYHGSRNSSFYFRTYDKKKQLWDTERVEVPHEKMWRFEVEVKNRATIQNFVSAGFPLFDGIKFNKTNLDGLKGAEKLIATALIDHPEMIKELGSRSTITKYKKILRESVWEDITPMFEKALKKELPQIKWQLERWERVPSIHEIMKRGYDDYAGLVYQSSSN